MPNPDYNSQVSQGYSKKGGARGWRPKKSGGKGPGNGPAQKDDPKNWPDPGPHWGTSFNRAAKFPVVKVGVVRKCLD